ncbi:MAG: FAD-dependent oxidoreductase, partial [Kiritimatiellae bacterium]|nr:FAD-dependent oxidoreductase [Kiritimatiellia bacterium]
MPQLKINGRNVVVERGTTLLDAARSIGIDIPTMCYLKGYALFTSCMICVVKEQTSGRFLPSCSAPAADGMIVETDSEEVHHQRKNALDLLLSEHVGDCEAPCRITCPAHMNIPLMIRQIAAGKMKEAIETVKEDIALPAVLGRICPEPCEKACRRSRYDASLAICLLKRFAADEDLSEKSPYMPVCRKASGKKVAIVGAGPAGLSAAYYLVQTGHACTILDDHPEPGGQLRYGVPENILPRAVLDKEIDVIRKLGAMFRVKCRVGNDVSMDQLKKEYDAIILSPGKTEPQPDSLWGIDSDAHGIKVDPHLLRTSDEKIFAGGEAVHPGHLAVRAVAHGKTMAVSIDQYLGGQKVTGLVRRFESRMGKLQEAEIYELMKDVDVSAGIEPAGGALAGFSAEEAIRESKRCMHCDCRKAEACKLRDFTDRYAASQKHFNVEGRKSFQRITTHTSVIFEPGKCIKC